MQYYTMRKKFALLAFCILPLLFFFNRGITLHDEGQMLHGAKRVLEGELPYRDFHLFYTPGAVWTTSIALRLFGESILAGRIMVLLVGVFGSFLVFLITQKLTRSSFLSITSTFVFLAWGPTHTNFPWPVVFVLTLGLMSSYFFIKAVKTHHLPSYFIAGFAAAGTLLYKQNLGLAVMVSMACGMWLFRKRISRQAAAILVFGMVIPPTAFFVYLLATHTFSYFVHDVYLYTIQKVVFEGFLSTPFVYGQSIGDKVGKTGFYLLPLLVAAAGFIRSFQKKKRSLLFLSIFTAVVYLAGIRPTTDYVHVTPFLSLTGLPLMLLFAGEKNRVVRIFIFSLTVLIIFIGIYTSIFKGYYRWEPALIGQTYFFRHPKAKIYLDAYKYRLLPAVLSAIRERSGGDPYIFVYDYAPMLYFLSEKKNPTRFTILQPGILSQQDEMEIVNSLRRKNVRLIVSHVPLDKSHNEQVEEFILDRYKKTIRLGEFTFYQRE